MCEIVQEHILVIKRGSFVSESQKKLVIEMTYLKSWEEFEKAAERLYFQDPMKVGFECVL